jgi:hypothetical protein
MAYEHPISTAAEAPSTGNDRLSGTSATELTAAVHALTQAAQALTTTATQMMQMMQTLPGPAGLGQSRPGAGAVTIQINSLEDDPFSEAVPTPTPPAAPPLAVPAPGTTHALLPTRIIEPQPAPGRFPPGSANFRYRAVMATNHVRP